MMSSGPVICKDRAGFLIKIHLLTHTFCIDVVELLRNLPVFN